jgi:hypothetical protein
MKACPALIHSLPHALQQHCACGYQLQIPRRRGHFICPFVRATLRGSRQLQANPSTMNPALTTTQPPEACAHATHGIADVKKRSKMGRVSGDGYELLHLGRDAFRGATRLAKPRWSCCCARGGRAPAALLRHAA